jgi:hypothetical protein
MVRVSKYAYIREALESLSIIDIQQVSLCLSVLTRTSENTRELLGIKFTPASKKESFRKLDVRITSREFGIVTTYFAGEIIKKEAIERLVQEFDVDESTAKRFIKACESDAKERVRINLLISKMTGQIKT